MIGLYTRYATRRSKAPASYKTVKTRRMLADRPGKYEHYTGFVEVNGATCAVDDGSFLIYKYRYLDFTSIAIAGGRWSGGTIRHASIYGGVFTGVDLVGADLYGGSIVSGRILDGDYYGGEIYPEVVQQGIYTIRPELDMQRPDQWLDWFNDNDVLAVFFKAL